MVNVDHFGLWKTAQAAQQRPKSLYHLRAARVFNPNHPCSRLRHQGLSQPPPGSPKLPVAAARGHPLPAPSLCPSRGLPRARAEHQVRARTGAFSRACAWWQPRRAATWRSRRARLIGAARGRDVRPRLHRGQDWSRLPGRAVPTSGPPPPLPGERA
jgi:hypothetical protein